MKNILVSLACILCLVIFGWATWHGTVYCFGQKAGSGVPVATSPGDGYTTTQSGSGYTLNIPSGMEEGHWYDYFKAVKNGYGGKNYVEDYYYDESQSPLTRSVVLL